MGMAIVGLDYRMQKVNRALCDALGYSERELLNRTFIEITHPDDIPSDVALAARLFRGEIPSYRLEKRFLTKDRHLVWLDLTALVVRGSRGEALYGLAMVEDVSERKRAEEALRKGEEQYRSFIANSSEGIWRFEADQPVDTSLPIDLSKAGFCSARGARSRTPTRSGPTTRLDARASSYAIWQRASSRYERRKEPTSLGRFTMCWGRG
jgi:PAS domain S-box-containing protein